jgi:3-methyladenine DNA glycosylase/8-oxoguanine DNA glycosylase
VSAGVETARRRRFRPVLPVDLRLTLSPLQRAGRWDPSVRVGDRETWRATRNPEGLATVRYIANGDEIEVEAWGPGAELELERAPRVLGGGDTLDGFVPHHAVVGQLHHRFPGLRIGRTEAVFEALVPTVMEQKVIGAEARAGYGRLIRSLGDPAPGPAGMTSPPGAAQLARTPYFEFHPFAIERRRAETIISAARRASWLEACVELPPAEGQARMMSLPGLGAWSAAEVAMVALGDADAVSVGDYHLPAVVAWALSGQPRGKDASTARQRGKDASTDGQRGEDAMMLELLEPYRGHRGRVLRLLTAGGVGPPRRGPRLALRRMERG